MGMPGLPELLIIALMLLLMIGVPVAIVALVIFLLVRRSHTSQNVDLSQNNIDLSENVEEQRDR